MDIKYNEVPSIISTKDLDYLTDMYNWNFNTCKLINSFLNNIEDKKIYELLNKTSAVHKNICESIINILS